MACPNLEIAGLSFIKAFRDFAGKDGDAKTLSKDELYQLAVAGFPTLCGHEKKEDILNGVFGKMDQNKDGKIDFQEYMFFNTCLIIALEDICK
ncbi:protein S100-G-like [Pseudophryne corroboree]|uniref:protein S100-G-like n=1 Tax=Pseudophryne corroboree TaxID=495146 RepID=UPI0030817AE9